MSAEPIDFAAVKAEHEGHTAGWPVCQGATPFDNEGHCLVYRLAVEAERLTEAWFDGEAGRLDWAARALNAERERDEARAEAERLAGKVARVESLSEWLAERDFEDEVRWIDVALADQPEQAQP